MNGRLMLIWRSLRNNGEYIERHHVVLCGLQRILAEAREWREKNNEKKEKVEDELS